MHQGRQPTTLLLGATEPGPVQHTGKWRNYSLLLLQETFAPVVFARLLRQFCYALQRSTETRGFRLYVRAINEPIELSDCIQFLEFFQKGPLENCEFRSFSFKLVVKNRNGNTPTTTRKVGNNNGLSFCELPQKREARGCAQILQTGGNLEVDALSQRSGDELSLERDFQGNDGLFFCSFADVIITADTTTTLDIKIFLRNFAVLGFG